MHGAARILIFAGVGLIALGVLMYGFQKIPWLGRLPGDIFVRRENFTFYFPLGTCIVISLLATVLLNLFGRK